MEAAMDGALCRDQSLIAGLMPWRCPTDLNASSIRGVL